MQKTTEATRIQFVDRTVDTPVVQQGQVPTVQTVQKTMENRQTQFLDEVAGMPVVVQHKVPMIPKVQKTAEVLQAQSTDEVMDTPVIMQRQVQAIQVAQKTVKDPQTQSIVKELRSKFEVGHKKKAQEAVHARSRLDKNRWREKTVEVPKVQYIDKVADIPLDVQRQVSTTQAAQDIDEVEDVPALTQSEVPNNPDDDEDWLEQERKKRKLPTPAETVSDSRADESDFDRFDDLILPSSQSCLCVSIASSDEGGGEAGHGSTEGWTEKKKRGRKKPTKKSAASSDGEEEELKQQAEATSLVQGRESGREDDETDAQGPGRQVVQVVHADWAQELREERRKFTDDVTSDMTDLKNDLAHVREMLGVLVRRERSAETKAEIAARRLDRMEREQHEADDAEHEASLEEALSNQSKVVKVLVDKWFVDKGYGFGKAPTGEVVFIHASTVQGAEVLTIGTDAWVQVVNDDARAQGGYRAKRAWGRNAWKAERDKEQANKVAQQVKRAAALTAELAAQSEKKTAVVCDQPPGLDELAGHIEAPNMGAGGSHPQATMMPDPWATYRCPSAEEGQTANNAPPETSSRVPANKGALAFTKGFREARSRSATRNVETRSMVDEALDFYVKATGRDGTQKREELVNMRPGELRRSLERWQARAKEVQRHQDKKEQAWDLYIRVPNFRFKNKENFEGDFKHRAVYDGKVDERKLQEWIDEMQPKVHAAERQLEARERKWMESEDSNSQRRRVWEKLWEPGAFPSSPYLSSLQR